MDATQVGLFQDCLVDLWAWDFNLGSQLDPLAVSNGIVKNQLGKKTKIKRNR